MSLTLILGPMFSCKTSQLLVNYDKHVYGKKGILCMWDKDTRYTNKSKLVTHSNMTRNAIKIKYVEELLEYTDDVDIIGIDEIQFLQGKKGEKIKDGPKNVRKILDKLVIDGKSIICAGLLKDYRRIVWPVVTELLGISDKTIFLDAICIKCSYPATCSYMKGHSKTSLSDTIITSSYSDFIPLCTKCYIGMYK